jgi:hypothetical protein
LGVLAALAMSAALDGCANVDFDSQQAWFAKPVDLFGRNSGYTYSELQQTKQQQRVIGTNDLVDANGACPAPVVQQQQPAPGAQDAAAPADTSSLLGTGVALGMSECDVVWRAGQPNSVQLGNAPNGDRTAVLTYDTGPRPGIYRFERGALMQMDRVEVAPPPVAQATKKKPVKSTKVQKKNDQT